jgi:hypothetical protein
LVKEQAPSDPLDDPAVAAMVDGAVARYRDTLSAAEIDALRSVLAIQLASHPVLARLMARVLPRAAPLASGELASGELASGELASGELASGEVVSREMTSGEVAADRALLSVAEGAAVLPKRPGKKAQGAG